MAKHALVVLAHPEIKSFNGGLAQVAEDTLKDMGWTVERSNLTQTGFDPVERAAHYPNIKNTERFDSQTEQRHAADLVGRGRGLLHDPGPLARQVRQPLQRHRGHLHA